MEKPDYQTLLNECIEILKSDNGLDVDGYLYKYRPLFADDLNQFRFLSEKIRWAIITDNRFKESNKLGINRDHRIIIANPDYKDKTWAEKHPVGAIFRTAGIAHYFRY
jgi:hypothetical protein